MHVLIAGAGVGGLTTALKLHRLGADVTIVEAAPELRPLGVGINLLPHGAAVLTDLGLGERLAATGIETRVIEYRTEFGQIVHRDPRGRHAGSPYPQYSIHRGHLQMLLLEAVLSELPSGTVRTDHKLVRFEQDASGVRAVIARGDGSTIEIAADALIGADGVNSTICKILHPNGPPLVFSGTMMWRGAIEREPFLDGETMVIAGHHESKAVIYPISREAARRGRSLVNWVAEIDVGRHAAYQQEDWTRPARAEDFVGPFENWHFDFLDVPALFRSTERIFVYPMSDRDALPFWTKGRVTLLGDAAHPMYPIGANGASQAILDADALGDALREAGTDNVETAFGLYDERRRDATARVVASNRAKGPEAVLQLARERVRGPADDVGALISQDEIDAITLAYQEVAGFDAPHLLKRAAGSAHKDLRLGGSAHARS